MQGDRDDPRDEDPHRPHISRSLVGPAPSWWHGRLWVEEASGGILFRVNRSNETTPQTTIYAEVALAAWVSMLVAISGCGRIFYDPLVRVTGDGGTGDASQVEAGLDAALEQDSGGNASDDAASPDVGPPDAGAPGPAMGFVALSAGIGHACAVGIDSNVYCWGNGFSGEVGDGTPGRDLVPVPVDVSALPPRTRFVSAGAAQFHSCAVTQAGDAYCWGADDNGQLGEDADGDSLDELVPSLVNRSAVPPGDGFVVVKGDFNHSCGLTEQGRILCWGSDANGQLGENADGDNNTESIPVLIDVSALAPGDVFVDVATGSTNSCAVTMFGAAYCWGSNGEGVLGTGDLSSSSVPVRVDDSILPPGVGFVQIASSGRHSCGLASNGTLYCWGIDENGALGENADGDNALETRPVPVDMSALGPGETFTAVSTGRGHTCALTSDRRAFCWGSDDRGKLGENADGDDLQEDIPVPVNLSPLAPGTFFTALSTGSEYSCGLANDGAIYCWGSDRIGQLGNGAPQSDVSIPAPVTIPATLAP